MGQEIGGYRFTAEDFRRFAGRLEAETRLLDRMARDGRLSPDGRVAGFELEAWLIDRNFYPVPNNAAYLERLANPLVVPELSRFNVELNGTPVALHADGLSRLERELAQTWRQCLDVAHDLESTLVLIGTLPTLREGDLNVANMSALNRYHALNEQILTARSGRPLHIEIEGHERISLDQPNVMLEAATTSFQVHIQVPSALAARYYNASLILSAPMVAVSANSPLLFDRVLWDETRIPVFEQAVGADDDAAPEHRRVTFGSGYLLKSVVEHFQENLERYPVLLPILFDGEPSGFRHLRLHNGTIWRWNRLLIGAESGQTPHVRLEHRVMPAGPSIADMMANAALYYGAVRFLAEDREAPESRLSFADARRNFYRAARYGMNARVAWLDGAQMPVRRLLLDGVLPMAQAGLEMLDVDRDDAERYLDIIQARVRTGQNGAGWQLAHVDRWGRDFFRLTANYLEHQRSGMPVHEWDT